MEYDFKYRLHFAGCLLLVFAVSQAQDSLGTWVELTEMPTARSEMRGAVIEGKIYVPAGFGGTSTLEAFEVASGTWEENLAEVPQNLDHHMVTAHEGQLYVMKGNTWIYDPGANRWDAGSGSQHRGDGAALTVGDYIYVMGGGPLELERFHPSTNTWDTLASMDVSRGHTTLLYFEDELWAIGGRNNNGAESTVEIYNPDQDQWRYGPEMLDIHSGHCAVAVGDNILVFGGEVDPPGSDPPHLITTAQYYNTANGEWREFNGPPLDLHGMACVEYQGNLYLIGGSTEAYAAVNSDQVFVFQPDDNVGIQGRNLKFSGTRSGLLISHGANPATPFHDLLGRRHRVNPARTFIYLPEEMDAQ